MIVAIFSKLGFAKYSLLDLPVQKAISLWFIVIALFLVLTTQSAHAAHCRTLKGQNVCIDWIKRSAKLYWEYQAVVSIDGKPQEKQVYDCRSRVIIDDQNTAFSFGKNDPGSVVCDLYRERSKSMRLSDLRGPIGE
jgi:hypothetical protein